jgi:hypothetical protein
MHAYFIHPAQPNLSDSANGQCCSTPKNEVKYLGMRLDRRMTWAKNIKGTRNQLNLKAKQTDWLLVRRAKL